jgi:adenylate kinase
MVSKLQGPALTILGRQGSGKGTQAIRLAGRYGLVHLSTGDLLREAVASGTPLGLRVSAVLEAGRLVADDIIFDVVAERLRDPEVRRRGFILDGFPRTPEQADDLVRLLAPGTLDGAILLDVPLEEVRRRLEARRVCVECGHPVIAEDDEDVVPCPECGGVAIRRPDDTPEAISRRLAIYEAEAEPLLTKLRDEGVLIRVDAMGSPDVVFERVLAALHPILWGTGQAVG